MKLIYIVNARIPTEKAHGIHIMQMCDALSELAEVELVLPRRLNRIKEDAFSYYGIKKSFKIRRLPCLDLIPLYKTIGHLGLWIESASFLLSLLFYIPFKKADIIYSRDKYSLLAGFFKKNFILETHNFPRHYNFYSPFFKRAKKIVVITQGLKDLFVKKGIVPDRILVLPDGVDLEKFEIRSLKSETRKMLNLPQDKKMVLYAGHLYAWKGAQTLAEASQYLPEDVEVYFVGGTTDDVEKFKLQTSRSRIHIIGHRPHLEIPLWLKAADVLVLPNSAKESISKYWTSPLKMFEYMAAQKPIVASDLPSIREVLNEDNSVLVEPDNPRALAMGVKKILEDAPLADKIAKNAFQEVHNYTWQKRAWRIINILS